MKKQKELDKLNKKIRNCKKCSLCKGRAQVVFGEGPANAKVMAVGQAPGAKENETGRPFVGRSGQFLTKLLQSAGLERKNIFITSVVKCFPPKNRKPSKEEIALDLPFLKKQIEIISPQKIILLGEVAFSVFFSEKKLKDLHGKILKKDGRDFFVSYHPAAGIRFQKMKIILEKDFKKLKNTLK